MKGQSAVENLTVVAAVIALIIPLSFLFITMSSFQKEQSEMSSLEYSLSQLTYSVEEIYSMCNEKEVKRLISLKFPTTMQTLEIDKIDGKPYFIATLQGNNQIAKNIEIKPTSSSFDTNAFSSGTINGGNIMLEISCIIKEDLGQKTAEIKVKKI